MEYLVGKKIVATSPNGATSVKLSDIDGDGDYDVCAAESSSITWYENLGAGNFGSKNTLRSIYNPRSVYVADLDMDGDMDIMSSGTSIRWFENTGGGNFVQNGFNYNNSGYQNLLLQSI